MYVIRFIMPCRADVNPGAGLVPPLLIIRNQQRTGVVYAAICKRGVFFRADRLFPYR